MMGFEFIDEEKEISGEADKTVEESVDETVPEKSTEAPKSEDQEAEVEETSKSDSYKIEDDGSVVYGKTKFKSMDDVFKSIENLQSLYGRQSTELGDLRKMKSEFEKMKDKQTFSDNETTEVKVNDDEYDVYDPNSVKTFIRSEATNIAKNMFDKWTNDKEVKDSFKSKMVSLKEANPTISDEQWMDIARFGDENGIANIEHAFLILKHQNKVSEAKSEGRKEVLGELGKVADIPQTLSNAGGSTKSDKIDFDALSLDEWGKLPDDVKERALLEA